jgi:transposase-like protein
VSKTVTSLTPQQREKLDHLASDPSVSQRIAVRARIILLSADGASGQAIAEELGINRSTVYGWRARFRELGLRGLEHGSGQNLALSGKTSNSKKLHRASNFATESREQQELSPAAILMFSVLMNKYFYIGLASFVIIGLVTNWRIIDVLAGVLGLPLLLFLLFVLYKFVAWVVKPTYFDL